MATDKKGTVCFINTVRLWGGGEKWHLETALHLQKRNWNVVVLALDGGELAIRARCSNLPVFTMDVGKFSFLNPFALNRLRVLLLEQRVTAVVLNSSLDLKFGGIAAWLAGISKIVYRRGMPYPIKNNFFNRFLMGTVLSDIIANSNAIKESICKNFSATKIIDKISVITNYVDLNDWQIDDKKSPSKDGRPVILGSLGRLVSQKGYEKLIEAASIIEGPGRSFKILVAGSGSLEGELRESIKRYELDDCVELCGFQNDVKKFISGLDIFVFPSLYEGCPNAVLEAMALGKPIVCFDIDSMTDLVFEGINGLVSPLGDIKSMAKNIGILINDGDLRDELGKNGRMIVENNFNHLSKLDVLEELLLSNNVLSFYGG